MPFSRDGYTARFEGFKTRFDAARRDAAEAAGQIHVRQVQKGILSGPKSGRVYNGKPAGAPGEYSQNRSGDLLNSGDYVVRQSDRLVVGQTAPHAVFQEGGARKINLEPRPNLQNGFRDAQGRIKSLLFNNVAKTILRG